MAEQRRFEKLEPTLRMVANGSTEVNAVRAEHAAAVAVADRAAEGAEPLRTQAAVPTLAAAADGETEVGDLKELPDARVSVFVHLKEDVVRQAHELEGTTARKANLVTAELGVKGAVELEDDPDVAFVELGQPLEIPTPIVASASPGRPALTKRKVAEAGKHGFGEDVLVGIIDVGGFDFAHEDFLDDDGHTRFVRIWDQGGNGDGRRSPGARAKERNRAEGSFDYGIELDQDDMNRAIDAAADGAGAPAWQLEPQTQMHEGSHATHVASIAAGNRGLARRAKIAGVLISIPDDEYERRRSFYDSSRIAHAVDYLLQLAREIGAKENREVPVSINVSLGTNGHAHDDSAAVSRWIDAALVQPGRSVAVAAGNAGQERAESADDVGFIMGRVHSSGRIPARDLEADIEWNVVGNGIADISENEMEIWYGAQDRFAVQVRPPGGDWTLEVEPGDYIENRQLDDGTFLSVYNELYNPANGCNYIAVYLSPFMGRPVVGVRAGQWLVRLIGRDVRDGHYHAWIERDDPRRVGRIGERDAWVFPSFFSERSFVDNSTVSSLACGQRIVSTANADEARRRINITSSQGPTRDGRQKPDIAAPGTDIVAAKGFTNGHEWIGMTGTSMASPYVAGVVGLMLGANPRLTGAQVGGIIRATAHPLPGHDYRWRDDAGSGLIDARECVVQAVAMNERRDVT
jgi:subtilisin family serine protease